jgi:hypothetical protein
VEGREEPEALSKATVSSEPWKMLGGEAARREVHFPIVAGKVGQAGRRATHRNTWIGASHRR